jgi:hypothetical protein
VKRIFGDISSTVETLAKRYWPDLQTAIKALQTFWETKLLPPLKEGGSYFETHMIPALQTLQGWWDKNRGSIEKFAGKAAILFGTLVGIWAVISAQLDGALLKFVGNALAKAFLGLVELYDAVEDVVDAVKDIINYGGQAAGVIGKLASGTGGVLGKGAKLLGFGQGGVVPGSTGAPTLAVVHGGEMVLPTDALTNTISPPGLSRGGRAGAGSSGGITINFNGPVVGGSQSDAATLARWLATAMTAAQQGQQRRTGQTVAAPAGVTG